MVRVIGKGQRLLAGHNEDRPIIPQLSLEDATEQSELALDRAVHYVGYWQLVELFTGLLQAEQ